MPTRGWSESKIEKLKSLWESDHSTKEIAELLDTTPTAVTQYVSRNRKLLGLDNRRPIKPQWQNVPRSVYSSSFEREWYGCVPRGHWSITKSWRQSC